MAAFAEHTQKATASPAPDTGVEAEPGNREYDSLLDCVIADQREADLPAYLLDLAGNLGGRAGPKDNAQGRLVFVITGQMVEAEESNR